MEIMRVKEWVVCMKSKNYKVKRAFTLAETLVTLLFIGIVASLVMPSLVNNFKQKQYDVQVKSFKQKFQEGMDTMRLRNRLMPVYDSTMDFVKEMQKHFNITQVCDSTHLSDCFEGNFTAKAYDENGNETASKTFKTKDLSDTKSLSPASDFNSDLAGVKFADGTGAILTRNPSCSGPTNSETNGDVYRCLGYIGFVGNLSKAHTLGRDMVTNMDLINPYGLSFKIVGRKDNVNWDEAKAYCQGMGASLPSAEQLTEMADKIYLVEGANCKKDISSTGQPLYSYCNSTVINQQPLKQYLAGDGNVFLWASHSGATTHAYNRYFNQTYTAYSQGYRISPRLAVCVK